MAATKPIDISFIKGDWNMFAVKTSGYSQRAVNIYKNCIGREYNPSERAWFFPNTAYEYLYNVIKNNDFNIVETIDPQDLKKIQVIISDENEKYFYVITPFDETIIGIFQNLNGYFADKKWCFKIEEKDDFLKVMMENDYDVKYLKDKPQFVNFLKLFSLKVQKKKVSFILVKYKEKEGIIDVKMRKKGDDKVSIKLSRYHRPTVIYFRCMGF